MSEFQQKCPGCEATLQLPIDSIGRRGVCPACSLEFTIGPLENQGDSSTGGSTQTPISVTPRAIEEIVGLALDYHNARRRRIYWPFLFHYLVFLILGIFPVVWINEQWNLGMPWAPPAAFAFTPVFLLLLTYSFWAAFALADEVVSLRSEDESSDWHHWIVPQLVPLASLYLVVVSMVACVAVLVATVLALVSWTSTASVGVVLLVWTLYVLIGCCVFIAGMTALWPLIPLAFQGRLHLQSFRHALSISLSNVLTSLLLMLIVLTMWLTGFAFATVGLLVAMPASALLLLVAIDRIEGSEGD